MPFRAHDHESALCWRLRTRLAAQLCVQREAPSGPTGANVVMFLWLRHHCLDLCGRPPPTIEVLRALNEPLRLARNKRGHSRGWGPELAATASSIVTRAFRDRQHRPGHRREWRVGLRLERRPSREQTQEKHGEVRSSLSPLRSGVDLPRSVQSSTAREDRSGGEPRARCP